MNAPLRQFASPYARKLARERGIVLADLGGSGPSGRVVAADVLAFRPPATIQAAADAQPAANPAQAATPASVVAALATEIDAGKLEDVVAQFAGARLPVSSDLLLLRAAARGLEAIGLKGAIGWETGGSGEAVIADAASLSLGALQARLGDPAGAARPAALSMGRLRTAGIRAVSIPLRMGRPMRLAISGNDGTIDCLLCFDVAHVGEEQAVEFLARFKDDVETPLRLLA